MMAQMQGPSHSTSVSMPTASFGYFEIFTTSPLQMKAEKLKDGS
jgi:hypothetical protein